MEAEAAVAEVAAEASAAVRVVDVDTDEALRARFTNHVPVTYVDGELHGYWFVDADKLRDELQADPRPMPDTWLPPVIAGN